jgi:hypothetical protein
MDARTRGAREARVIRARAVAALFALGVVVTAHGAAADAPEETDGLFTSGLTALHDGIETATRSPTSKRWAIAACSIPS